MSTEEHLHDEIEAQVEASLDVLPSVAKLLFMTLARYPKVAGRSLAQIKMLIHLHHTGSCTVGEVAEACGVSMSAASELIDRLVDDDMVTRRANPDDRRQVLLAPTDQARRLGEEIREMRSHQIRTTLARLAPEHRASFSSVLGALAATLQEDLDQGCFETPTTTDS